MNRAMKIPGFKVLSAKILLTIILFFSIFTIAGYNSNSNILFRQKAQTELTYSTGKKNSPTNGLYKKFLLRKFNNDQFYAKHKNEAIALLLYNRLEKTRFRIISQKQLSWQIPNSFMQLKTIPVHYSETNFSSAG